jgi:hypothetical protein
VASVGLGSIDQAATPVVPCPDQFRISRKRLWCGEILRAELLPETRCTTEGGNTALGGNARPGQDRN